MAFDLRKFTKRNWMTSRLAPLAVLIVCLVTTFFVYRYVATTTHSSDQVRFDALVEEITDAVNTRFDVYLGLLRGTAGLFSSSDYVSASDFHNYTTQLKLPENYPGIQGIGFAKRVLSGKEADFAAVASAELGRDVTIRPAGDRAEYFPILYLEPLDVRNAAAIGFDMFSEPVRSNSMVRARDEATDAISGKVTLVQEIFDIKQAGFLRYMPVYEGGETPRSFEERRKKLIGFVYSPFRGDDLFVGIFNSRSEPQIHFEVYNGLNAAPEDLIYRSPYRPSVSPMFSESLRVSVSGREWLLVFATTDRFNAASNAHWINLVLVTGVVLSFLIFYVTAALTKAKDALAEANRDLEGKVAERTAKLQEIITDLESFSYSISHDLRAPLRSMQGFGQLLQEDFGHRLDDVGREYVRRIISAGARLDNLIQDVLTYSRVARSELKMEVVDLDKMIPAILQDSSDLNRRDANIRVEHPLQKVIANGALMTQCISNLLDNAIKFVPKDRRPMIRLFTRAVGDKVRFCVEDNGMGVLPDQREKIFNMFERGYAESEYGGTGIGLAIVKRAVHKMGGSVGLESEPGKGSCFWIELPKVSETYSKG